MAADENHPDIINTLIEHGALINDLESVRDKHDSFLNNIFICFQSLQNKTIIYPLT